MTITRVKSYTQDGKYTHAEMLFPETRQDIAIDKFKKAYPEHNDCIVVAEYFDSNDPKYSELIELYLKQRY